MLSDGGLWKRLSMKMNVEHLLHISIRQTHHMKRFLDYVYNFTIWSEISLPNQTSYEQDDTIRTFKLLKTQYDEECADYAH